VTIHRPHPIVGPWPYVDTEPLTLARRVSTPLVRREPTDDSRIYDDPDDALLFDGCDRCAEHASSHGFGSLDNVKLGELWSRMVAVEKHDVDHYRTATEAAACRRMYEVALIVERLGHGIDPWRWPWLLRTADGAFALMDGVTLIIGEVTFGDGS
jgi:hypothetical protein